MNGGARWFDLALGLFAALVLLALYAPALLVALFSVVPYRQGHVLWGEASLGWYAQLARNADILEALRQSLLVAAAAVAASLVVGTGLALWAESGRAWGTLSLDETLITVVLAGDTMTLPLRLWAMMRVGFTPEVNALVTLVLVATGIVTLAVGLRLRSRDGGPASEV